MSFTLVAFTFASLAAQDVPTNPVGTGGDLGASVPSASPPAAQATRSESNEARPADGAAPGGSASRPQAESAPAGTAQEGDRRICRRIVTSRSHRYQRVCLTAEEWRRMDN